MMPKLSTLLMGEPITFLTSSVYHDHPEHPGSGEDLASIVQSDEEAEEFRRYCRRKGYLWPHTVSALKANGVTPGRLWDALLDLGL